MNLAESGGHDVQFAGRRIYPLKFLLKHYPLRNRAQAERKVFQERAPRASRERRERGWHTHYDALIQSNEIAGWRAHDLIPCQAHYFSSEFLVEWLSQIGLAAPS